MFLQLLTALLAFHCTILTTSASEKLLTKALQFGYTHDDYVKFSPDMSQVKDSLTVCSWVKKQLTGIFRSWFLYSTSTYVWEIQISDGGHSNKIHGMNNDLRSAVTVPLNTWTHQCQSWSTSTGTVKTYYNGTLIGSKTISRSHPLEEGGVITLGDDLAFTWEGHIFGGQLMKLDIFGKELSPEEVAELFDSGRCSDIEKKHQEVRFITWESILSQSDKTGNVTEVDSGCPAEEEEGEEKEDCECTHSIWDILYDQTCFNQTLTTEKLTKLKSTWNMLDHFIGTPITENIISHYKAYHPMPVEEANEEKEEGDCECTRSIWNMLNDQTFFNQTVTAEKLTELKANWNMLDYFVGTPITENIIAYFKAFHPMPAEVQDDSS